MEASQICLLLVSALVIQIERPAGGGAAHPRGANVRKTKANASVVS